MAFDEALAKRIRVLVASAPAVAEKKMFGGLAFFVSGNMSVCVHGSDLIVRVDPKIAAAVLTEPGAAIFDLTGRPMQGWVLVSGETLVDKRALAKWVRRGLAFAQSLPAK